MCVNEKIELFMATRSRLAERTPLRGEYLLLWSRGFSPSPARPRAPSSSLPVPIPCPRPLGMLAGAAGCPARPGRRPLQNPPALQPLPGAAKSCSDAQSGAGASPLLLLSQTLLGQQRGSQGHPQDGISSGGVGNGTWRPPLGAGTPAPPGRLCRAKNSLRLRSRS